MQYSIPFYLFLGLSFSKHEAVATPVSHTFFLTTFLEVALIRNIIIILCINYTIQL